MANPEHLELVRSGVEAINKAAAERDRELLDLEGADLSGLNLANARLDGANMANVDLSRSDLREARLNAANMSGCNLREADLRGAAMHRTDLTGADLRGARFDAIGIGGQRICVSPETFKDVHWDRDKLEEMLEQINLNPDWEVRWELAPKQSS